MIRLTHATKQLDVGQNNRGKENNKILKQKNVFTHFLFISESG